jgi:hypothetical protein
VVKYFQVIPYFIVKETNLNVLIKIQIHVSVARYSLTDIYQIYYSGGVGNILSSVELYTLKMEAVGAYYALKNIYTTTWHQISLNSNLHS